MGAIYGVCTEYASEITNVGGDSSRLYPNIHLRTGNESIYTNTTKPHLSFQHCQP